ncbi:hypothetical protein IPN35_01650 [Candidatus Peregrinibacteria bacterium]|nr:MAG: hypothetical protein IPN35_01650 [Candidatus Peregrinibacteria bacterium]
MKNWKTEEMESFFSAILLLKTSEEVGAFFRDVCTLSELSEMSRRLLAAKIIHSGASIRSVAEQTSLSTTTVCRVSHWMKQGAGGYDFIFSRTK